MSEKYLKEIANELKLIRKELQMDRAYDEPQHIPEPEDIHKPGIADQLNHMFKKY